MLPESERIETLKGLTETEALELLYRWDFWGRPNQIAPAGDWRTWLILAGRGYGKTRAGSEWVRARVKAGARRIALVAETQRDLEQVIVDGDSGILAVCPPDERPIVTRKPVKLVFPNGAIALGYNGTEPDQLRGPQFDTAWLDELAKYRYAQQTWDMLQFGMRLGDDPRALVTTTPRPIPLLKVLMKEPSTIITRGKTSDNRGNLAASFIGDIERRYAGTRLGRQELSGEILDDVPGALWTRSMLDDQRKTSKDLPDMQRVVVAIDPAAKGAKPDTAEGDHSNAETGIIVAGMGVDGRGYVLDDLSCRLGPNGWARRALSGYDMHSADAIVVETNQGGDMVRETLRSVRQNVKIIEVHASRGKVTRAEPIAALYEQGRVSHVGAFAALEDQMVLFTPMGIEGDTTADRVDALVWAFTQLFPAMVRKSADKIKWEFGTGAGGPGAWMGS